MAERLGVARIHRLLDHFGSAENVFAATTNDLVNQLGFPFEIAEYICNQLKRNDLLSLAHAELDFLTRNNARAISIDDHCYPYRLKECCDSPSVLYVKGNMDFNSEHFISVVGTRRFSKYGEEFCDEFMHELSELVPDAIIVSGLAYGIDIIAEKAAHKYGLKTVSVVANNLRGVTPAAHLNYLRDFIEAGGAVVTEMSTIEQTIQSSFLRRNRIIAGLSDGTLVVESHFKGGALSTARCAMEYNREVMAVPGRVNDASSEGCNDLIRKGVAQLITCAEHLADTLGWKHRNSATKVQEEKVFSVDLSDDERVVYDSVGAITPTPLDLIVSCTGISVQLVSVLLVSLEMKNLIRPIAGNQYIRV